MKLTTACLKDGVRTPVPKRLPVFAGMVRPVVAGAKKLLGKRFYQTHQIITLLMHSKRNAVELVMRRSTAERFSGLLRTGNGPKIYIMPARDGR